MALDIRNISECSPDEHSLYFLDANVWIAILKHTGSQALKPSEQACVDFFEAVVGYHDKPAHLKKKLKNLPKFVITSLLLSEIINAYMRKVAMVAFFAARSENARDYDFKSHYRGTPDYNSRLRNIITDIQAFREYYVFEDDRFKEVDPEGMLMELSQNPAEYDINDLYFGRLARINKWVLVSNDADSVFDEVIVLTANRSLLHKMTSRKK